MEEVTTPCESGWKISLAEDQGELLSVLPKVQRELLPVLAEGGKQLLLLAEAQGQKRPLLEEDERNRLSLLAETSGERLPLLAESRRHRPIDKMAVSQLTPTLIIAICGAVLGMFYFGYNTGVVRFGI